MFRVRERPLFNKPCPCSSRAGSFKIHRHRYACDRKDLWEAGFNESIADHKSGKTFSCKGLSRK